MSEMAEELTLNKKFKKIVKQERLPSNKLGPCDSVLGQPRHCLFISLALHSSASACFHYSIYHVFVSLISDLQAEIWLSIADLSPIITLLQSIMFSFSFSKKSSFLNMCACSMPHTFLSSC